jgi:hypothetical protein
MNKIHEWINTGLIVAVGILLLVGGNQSAPVTPLGGITNLDSLTLGENLVVGGTVSNTGTTTATGPFISDSSVTRSFTNSTTSSAAALTVGENDFAPGGRCYSTFSYTKTVGISGGGNLSTSTLTTLATSTFSNMIPNVGDSCEILFESATSSASQLGMILAFGTGWDPHTASTTPTGLTINGGDSARLLFYRKWNTDIGVHIIIDKDAD